VISKRPRVTDKGCSLERLREYLSIVGALEGRIAHDPEIQFSPIEEKPRAFGRLMSAPSSWGRKPSAIEVESGVDPSRGEPLRQLRVRDRERVVTGLLTGEVRADQWPRVQACSPGLLPIRGNDARERSGVQACSPGLLPIRGNDARVARPRDDGPEPLGKPVGSDCR
jgi:hypothetical protein